MLNKFILKQRFLENWIVVCWFIQIFCSQVLWFWVNKYLKILVNKLEKMRIYLKVFIFVILIFLTSLFASFLAKEGRFHLQICNLVDSQQTIFTYSRSLHCLRKREIAFRKKTQVISYQSDICKIGRYSK